MFYEYVMLRRKSYICNRMKVSMFCATSRKRRATRSRKITLWNLYAVAIMWGLSGRFSELID